MSFILEIIISALIVIGGFFALVGSFGLVKLPDLMTRLHGPTKATTLGVGSILVASMLYFWLLQDSFTIHELLITLFLLLTAPITANVIAKAYMLDHADPDKDLPKTGGVEGWATFDAIGQEDDVDAPTTGTEPARKPVPEL
ncbi:Na+/H+ antiporter subunit G [Thalassospira sp.]|uniref:Na+/H+ antiporter subunit G n=1 Tax=Thalassospira sp. TaxID=1912094 RepID=UPI002732C5B0|nr:Na+/H+ antiporter subunit G [Thalassospira sp.]MDP2697325.1 Na+/H+ antiporter subunit G [Thalassospira sp.]